MLSHGSGLNRLRLGPLLELLLYKLTLLPRDLTHPTVAIGMCLCAVAGAGVCTTAQASPLGATAAFVQAGSAQETQTLVFGLNWAWPWRGVAPGGGRLSGYWEAAVGRWHGAGQAAQHSSAWVTQLGATAVLRWQPASWGDRWALEAGLGANSLVPIYHSGSKQFGSVLNFGNHLAVLRRWGPSQRHELSVRLEHFSNAGIREPNPGENFLQLRYAQAF